jgi:hypothetical protein
VQGEEGARRISGDPSPTSLPTGEGQAFASASASSAARRAGGGASLRVATCERPLQARATTSAGMSQSSKRRGSELSSICAAVRAARSTIVPSLAASSGVTASRSRTFPGSSTAASSAASTRPLSDDRIASASRAGPIRAAQRATSARSPFSTARSSSEKGGSKRPVWWLNAGLSAGFSGAAAASASARSPARITYLSCSAR